jgi:hypothetical protein
MQWVCASKKARHNNNTNCNIGTIFGPFIILFPLFRWPAPSRYTTALARDVYCEVQELKDEIDALNAQFQEELGHLKYNAILHIFNKYHNNKQAIEEFIRSDKFLDSKE